MEHSSNPFLFPPPPPEEVTFIMPTLMKLGQLCRQGIERGLYVYVMHVFFAGWARLLPTFDGSGDFALASLHATWTVSFAALALTLPVAFLHFLVPLVLRRKACVAAGNFGPANELRRQWTPAFMAPWMRRAYIHVFVVLAFIVGAFVIGVDESSKRRVLDPFHVGVLAVISRVMYCAVRAHFLGDAKEAEVLLPSDYYNHWSAIV